MRIFCTKMKWKIVCKPYIILFSLQYWRNVCCVNGGDLILQTYIGYVCAFQLQKVHESAAWGLPVTEGAWIRSMRPSSYRRCMNPQHEAFQLQKVHESAAWGLTVTEGAWIRSMRPDSYRRCMNPQHEAWQLQKVHESAAWGLTVITKYSYISLCSSFTAWISMHFRSLRTLFLNIMAAAAAAAVCFECYFCDGETTWWRGNEHIYLFLQRPLVKIFVLFSLVFL